MPVGIDTIKYFSQWDGDNGGARGACGETCLKMIDQYLTGREIPISAIIANGDGNPLITSIAGMKKAADYLGFGVDYYYDSNPSDIRKWLSEGKLIVAVLKYGLFPNKYKQDKTYASGHFVLITAIADDNGIRFADPNFRDGTLNGHSGKRNDGWMDNNKWAMWGDFAMAFNHNDGNISRNGAVLVSKKAKQTAPPPPPPDPCADVKKQLQGVSVERDSLKTQLATEQGKRKKAETDLGVARAERDTYKNKVTDLDTKIKQKDVVINSKEEIIEEKGRLLLDANKAQKQAEDQATLAKKMLDDTVRENNKVIGELVGQVADLMQQVEDPLIKFSGIELVSAGIRKLLIGYGKREKEAENEGGDGQ